MSACSIFSCVGYRFQLCLLHCKVQDTLDIAFVLLSSAAWYSNGLQHGYCLERQLALDDAGFGE